MHSSDDQHANLAAVGLAKVAVIGGGLAGLNCAVLLSRAGVDVTVYEASERVGGRVKTDCVDGFLLDHGFQVLQTAYPEARAAFDYLPLNLQPFGSGAVVQTERGPQWMVDPWRKPSKALATLFNSVGGIGDRLRLAQLRTEALRSRLEASSDGDCAVAEELSLRRKFSTDFVDRFLRPWISGMFFDEELATSADFFKFIFKTLATAEAAVPAKGMEQLPLQMASRLPQGAVQVNRQVLGIQGKQLLMEDGTREEASHIVVATNCAAAGESAVPALAAQSPSQFVSTLTFYFAATETPELGKFLMLNGERDGGGAVGAISNLCVPSNISPHYAPENNSLVCVTVRPSLLVGNTNLDIAAMENEVLKQASRWFGSSVDSWRLIRHFYIRNAVPRLLPGAWKAAAVIEATPNVFLCGDQVSSPSVNGALLSGRVTAEHILRSLHGYNY